MPAKRPESERFWEKIDWDNVDLADDDACWPWKAGVSNGYGVWNRTHLGFQNTWAHRFAFEQLRGPIPEGLTIDHLCRVKLCQNPWHMEPVTREENGRRANEAFWAELKGWTDDMLPWPVSV